jgi:hypothetical protein
MGEIYRHIKRLAHGIPEDKVSNMAYRSSLSPFNNAPLPPPLTTVGFLIGRDFASHEAWRCHRGVYGAAMVL